MNEISSYLEVGVSFLKRHNVPDPDISALSLLAYVLEQPELDVKMNPEIHLTCEQEEQFESLVIKRATRYPMQYLIKRISFRNAVLEIGEGCLIPRPETELLIDVVLNKLVGAPPCGRPSNGAGKHGGPPLQVLEIGTGSGNIAVSLAMERSLWMFTATDISEEALRYARKNSILNRTNHQINFVKTDLFSGVNETFDAIISNPPYLKTEDLISAQTELSFEPSIALDGGQDGLSYYKRILKIAKSALKPGGHIFFEVGYNQATDVVELMKPDFELIECVKDYAGYERIISGCFTNDEAHNFSFTGRQ